MPGGFVLAQTLERVYTPPDLVGFVEGRSSWARIGVTIHVTAPKIDPGFDATITLEMGNFGKIPVELRAGVDEPLSSCSSNYRRRCSRRISTAQVLTTRFKARPIRFRDDDASCALANNMEVHVKRVRIALVLVLLTGCASTPGVVSIGPDTFMVSRQAATGFSGMSGLMEAAMREGNAHCRAKGLIFQVVNTTQSEPPYIFGNFPKASVQFMCLNAADPELSRPKLQPVPNVVIGTAPPLAGSTPLNAPPVEKVRVAIDSEPSGADVNVDGAFVGNTPLPEFKLTPGQHDIEVKKLGFATWTRRITVVADTPTNVRATLGYAVQ